MLTERVEFVPERDAEIFASAPAAPAVFLFRGADANAEPYISKTANLRRRLLRLLSAPTEQSKRLNLRERVRWIEYSATGSDFESGFLLYRLLRAEFPKTYAKRLRLRFAPLVKMHAENPYPRASVTTRLGRASDLSKYYGPFLSRVAAEKFMTLAGSGNAAADAQGQPQPQAQPQPQHQDNSIPTSTSDAVVKGLGGLFNKKKKQQQEQQPQQTEASTPAPASTPGALMEMQSEVTNYSNDALDGGMFASLPRRKSNSHTIRTLARNAVKTLSCFACVGQDHLGSIACRTRVVHNLNR